jgi:hypothetical protein
MKHTFIRLLLCLAPFVPVVGDEFVLTSARPMARETITIDKANEIFVHVTSMSRQLTVTIVSPSGHRFTIGAPATSIFKSAIARPTEIGEPAHYTASLQKPTAGTWTVEVAHERAITSRIDGAITANALSPLSAVLVLSAPSTYPLGTTVKVGLSITDDERPLAAHAIKAVLIGPDGNKQTITFRDDGLEPDDTSGDFRYTANIVPDLTGRYRIAATVASVIDGHPFERCDDAQFEVVTQTTKFVGTFGDTAIDEDKDGLYDALVVSPQLDIAEPGTYDVSVRLESRTGEVVQKAFRGPLEAGLISVPVWFSSEAIRRLMVGGPFRVSYASIDHVQADDARSIDHRRNLGETSAYDLRAFKSTLHLTGEGSAEGVDRNDNRLFDELRIALEIISDRREDADVTGTLTSATGEVVTKTSSRQHWSDGANELTLAFNGRTLSDASDGPYSVSVHVSGTHDALFEPKALITPLFRASQFETECVRAQIEHVRERILAIAAEAQTDKDLTTRLGKVEPLLAKFLEDWNQPPADLIAAVTALEGAVTILEGARFLSFEIIEEWIGAIVTAADGIAAGMVRLAQQDPAGDAAKIGVALTKLEEARNYAVGLKSKGAVRKLREALMEAQTASPRRLPRC